ncbi:MAG: hypothetical protein HC877_04275 [Thioploca sp.]|nr:hypothetical protein [Thioploca sp.]
MRCDGEYFHLSDLNSQHGTLVYGINIASSGSVPLLIGECFTVGDSTFQVRWWSPEVLRILHEQSEPLLALIDASRDKRIWPLSSHSEAHYRCLMFIERQPGTIVGSLGTVFSTVTKIVSVIGNVGTGGFTAIKLRLV